AATFVPGIPLVGESVRVGPEARVAANGTTYSATATTMTSVASQSRARVRPLRVGVTAASGTQADPFQNVMRSRLPSVVRPAPEAPGLGGPARRRGCPFVDDCRTRRRYPG